MNWRHCPRFLHCRRCRQSRQCHFRQNQHRLSCRRLLSLFHYFHHFRHWLKYLRCCRLHRLHRHYQRYHLYRSLVNCRLHRRLQMNCRNFRLHRQDRQYPFQRRPQRHRHCLHWRYHSRHFHQRHL